MEEVYVFYPPKRLGLLIHAIGILILVVGGAAGLWQASRARVGPVFLLYLLPVILAVAVVPILAYRAYALQGASYTLERDGIRLRWGLRAEDIPVDSVQWVGPVESLDYTLPRPVVRIPGAVLGLRRLPDARAVEYLASRANRLVLITTPKQAYAISPADSAEFLKAFQWLMEWGSLTSLPARSVFPNLLIFRSWSDRPARILLVGGLLLSLSLLAWVGLALPARAQIALRLTPEGLPADFVPAVRLWLLPVLNTFFFLADTLLGLFFYRREETQPLAYLLWGTSMVTSLGFLGAVYFVLRAG